MPDEQQHAKGASRWSTDLVGRLVGGALGRGAPSGELEYVVKVLEGLDEELTPLRKWEGDGASC